MPQSTRPVLEMPVARCGSRMTCTPAPWSASLRAISMSSGVESESPVTSSLCSGCWRGRHWSRARSARGRRPRLAWKPPPVSFWSGESQEVRSRARARRTGAHRRPSRRGWPIALTMSLPSPGLSSSRCLAGPRRRRRAAAGTCVSAIALTASQALKRRSPQRSKRSIRLSSPCGSPSRPGGPRPPSRRWTRSPPASSRSSAFFWRGSVIRSGNR